MQAGRLGERSALGGDALVFSGKPAKFRRLATVELKSAAGVKAKEKTKLGQRNKLMKV